MNFLWWYGVYIFSFRFLLSVMKHHHDRCVFNLYFLFWCHAWMHIFFLWGCSNVMIFFPLWYHGWMHIFFSLRMPKCNDFFFVLMPWLSAHIFSSRMPECNNFFFRVSCLFYTCSIFVSQNFFRAAHFLVSSYIHPPCFCISISHWKFTSNLGCGYECRDEMV